MIVFLEIQKKIFTAIPSIQIMQVGYTDAQLEKHKEKIEPTGKTESVDATNPSYWKSFDNADGVLVRHADNLKELEERLNPSTDTSTSTLPPKDNWKMVGDEVRFLFSPAPKTSSTSSSGPEGEKPLPLVFVPGFGAGIGIYYRFLPELRKRFHGDIYILDIPGGGGSFRGNKYVFQKKKDVAISYFCTLIEQFLVGRGVIDTSGAEKPKKKFILCGHSFGGYLCTSLATKIHPHIAALCLVSPLFGFPPMEEPQAHKEDKNEKQTDSPADASEKNLDDSNSNTNSSSKTAEVPEKKESSKDDKKKPSWRWRVFRYLANRAFEESESGPLETVRHIPGGQWLFGYWCDKRYYNL